MKKSLMLGFAGMLFVSASASAISISGQAGEDYTNLGFGMGTETTGLASGRLATASACLVSIITLPILFPAVSTAMKKRMQVRV